MFMAKGMGKKLISALAIVAIALCLVLSGAFSAPAVAFAADSVDYVKTYDAEHEYSKDEARAVFDYVIGEYKLLYNELKGYGIDIDETGEQLKQAQGYFESEINDLSADYNKIASKYLGEDTIRGVTRVALEFYNYYLDKDGKYRTEDIASYTKENADAVVERAWAYAKEQFKLEKFNHVYSSNKAWEIYNAFEENKAISDIKDSERKLADKRAKYIEEINAVYDLYHSDRYDADEVDAVVRPIERENAVAAVNAATNEEAMSKAVKEYTDKYIGVPTYMKAKLLKIQAEELYFRQMSESDNNQRARKLKKGYEITDLCQDSLDYYNEKLEGEGDGNDASSIMTLYKSVANKCLELIKSYRNQDYGYTADKVINNNLSIAKSLISSVDRFGYIPSPYTYYRGGAGEGIVQKAYTPGTVNTATSVLRAFEDSYYVSGALKFEGQTSQKPDGKIATISATTTDGKIRVTVTSVDSGGTMEVPDFDSTARLVARVGTTPSIIRNINVILGKSNVREYASANVTDAQIEKISGKHLQSYFNLQVYENDVLRETFEGHYRITIVFDSENDVLNRDKASLNVINYYHTEITGAVVGDNIDMDGNTMEFVIDKFNQFALLSDVAWTDWAMYALYGVIGIIVLIILLYIIVALIKNRKFTIEFNANGGKSTKFVKVKNKEKFSYPKNPTRTGYVFMGWYTTKKCDVRFASTQMLGKRRITVYAKWITEEEYARLLALGNDEVTATISEGDTLEKLEAEKLEYEAKKEEEIRKAEEVRLLTAQQLEENEKNAEARAKAEQEAEDAKAQLEEVRKENEQLKEQAEKDAEARKAAEEVAAKNAKEAEDAKKAAEEAAKAGVIAATVAAVSAEPEEEEAPDAPVEEKKAFDANEKFDDLKSEIYSYNRADDLPYGLDESETVAIMKVEDGKIVLELDADAESFAAKGYAVSAGEKLPVKVVVGDESEYDTAKELVEEAMLAKGLRRVEKAVLTSATDDTMENGFEYKITYDRKAENAQELLKILRVYTKSFVLADDKAAEEKPLVKAFVVGDKLYAYLNYSAEGMNACDEELAAKGYKSFMVARNTEECKALIAAIGAMMKENGLIRYPLETNIAEEKDSRGFTYTLKA